MKNETSFAAKLTNSDKVWPKSKRILGGFAVGLNAEFVRDRHITQRQILLMRLQKMNTLIRAAGGQIARKAAPHGEDRGVHLGKGDKKTRIWLSHSSGEPITRIDYEVDGKSASIFTHPPSSKKWKRVARIKLQNWDDDIAFRPIAVSDDTTELYMLSRKEEIVDLGVDQVMAPTVKPWGSVRSSRGDADRLCSDKRFCKSTIKLEDASCENHIDNRR